MYDQKYRGTVKKITAYPMLLGVLVAFLIAGAIFATVIWAPWMLEAFDKHRILVQAVWFTVAFFVVAVYRLWPRRHRVIFWASLCILFLLHVLGILLYTTYVQPIRVWQWVFVYLLEASILVFFLDWSRRRFGHSGKRGRDSQ